MRVFNNGGGCTPWENLEDHSQVVRFVSNLMADSWVGTSLTVAARLPNLTIAQRLGCLTPAGLHDMRRGQSPTLTTGPDAGDP